MTNPKTGIGIVGCGNISGTYFNELKKYARLEVVACADLDLDRARQQAAQFQTPRACAVPELLADPAIEIVVNLTIPRVHGEIGLAALAAGKNVYNEKPLATCRDEAQRMLQLAKTKNLRVGGAPDTFLGGGIQTCRKLIDDGWIGRPVGATAFMTSAGHERWHPNPDFFYQPGGGPMFDMGPYYLTTLVCLLGPVTRVTGSAKITRPERLILSQPRAGERIKVNTPTHIAGIMDFACGAVGTILTSFDVCASQLPRIEIYGTEGSLSVPDPNGFGGPVLLHRANAEAWTPMPLSHGYTQNNRGVGVADMAAAIRSGRPHRASAELAHHVLDLMQSFLDASRDGRHISIQSACDRPAPLPPGLRDYTLDD